MLPAGWFYPTPCDATRNCVLEHLLSPLRVVKLVEDMLGSHMHLKRAESIAYAVIGAMHAGRWSIAEIGRAMARARGTSPKHGIKQIDRLLSNEDFDLGDGFKGSVPFIVGARKRIVVAIDWTDFAGDDQSTVAIRLITNHGRATPLVWKSVRKSELEGQRNAIEDEVLMMLRDSLPTGVRVTVLADRGFGSIDFFAQFEEYLKWDYIVRFRGGIGIYDESGTSRTAASLIPEGGGVADVRSALLTKRGYKTRVVCTRQPRMKDDWCLATSMKGAASSVIALYGRRFTIEESFRDEKDHRFGFGLSDATIGTPERRDRLLFVTMLAMIFLTMIGAAGEQLRLDRGLNVNTVTHKRSLSLLRQAREYVAGAFHRLWADLRAVFYKLLQEHAECVVVHAII